LVAAWLLGTCLSPINMCHTFFILRMLQAAPQSHRRAATATSVAAPATEHVVERLSQQVQEMSASGERYCYLKLHKCAHTCCSSGLCVSKSNTWGFHGRSFCREAKHQPPSWPSFSHQQGAGRVPGGERACVACVAWVLVRVSAYVCVQNCCCIPNLK